ncbi:MAG: copper amine oxidase N-terminal domain-containing protein [Clostridia bacterium]|nr:copper amine oxidase N-terminal domain-containing protein [Clostridia bacterium]
MKIDKHVKIKSLKLLAAVLFISFLLDQSVLAVSVVMNSTFVDFPSQKPVVVNERLLIPIRPLAEKLGLSVEWDGNTKTVTLSKENYLAKITIGAFEVETSGGSVRVKQGAEIIEDTTMVSPHFLSDVFGLKVIWQRQYNSVIIIGSLSSAANDANSAGKEVGELSEPTDPTDPTQTSFSDDERITLQVQEEEPAEIEEEALVLSAAVGESVITINLPASFNMEADTESETAFSYRAVDATDIQHSYDWTVVSQYESYSNAAADSGIFIIVQDFGEPSEGYALSDDDIANLSSLTSEFSEPEPEAPGISYSEVMQGINDLAMEKYEALAADNPELSEEELQALLSETELDYSAVPGYTEWMEWMELRNQWSRSRSAFYSLSNKAYRNWSAVSDKLSDEEWVSFFTWYLNSDEEVMYTNVSVAAFGEKKAVHALIEAKDPDDEQGTFDAYIFFDGNSVATIYGGTLYSAEAASEAVETLAAMTIQ